MRLPPKRLAVSTRNGLVQSVPGDILGCGTLLCAGVDPTPPASLCSFEAVFTMAGGYWNLDGSSGTTVSYDPSIFSLSIYDVQTFSGDTAVNFTPQYPDTFLPLTGAEYASVTLPGGAVVTALIEQFGGYSANFEGLDLDDATEYTVQLCGLQLNPAAGLPFCANFNFTTGDNEGTPEWTAGGIGTLDQVTPSWLTSYIGGLTVATYTPGETSITITVNNPLEAAPGPLVATLYALVDGIPILIGSDILNGSGNIFYGSVVGDMAVDSTYHVEFCSLQLNTNPG